MVRKKQDKTRDHMINILPPSYYETTSEYIQIFVFNIIYIHWNPTIQEFEFSFILRKQYFKIPKT